MSKLIVGVTTLLAGVSTLLASVPILLRGVPTLFAGVSKLLVGVPVPSRVVAYLFLVFLLGRCTKWFEETVSIIRLLS